MFRFPDYGFLTGDLKKSASFVRVCVLCVFVVVFFLGGEGGGVGGEGSTCRVLSWGLLLARHNFNPHKYIVEGVQVG